MNAGSSEVCTRLFKSSEQCGSRGIGYAELDRLLHDLDSGVTAPQRYPVQGADAFVWLRLGDVVGVEARDRPAGLDQRASAAGSRAVAR